MSNPTLVSWCPGTGCDPCAVGGVRLDASGNVWVEAEGYYYDGYQTPYGILPINVRYNGEIIWSFPATGTPLFEFNDFERSDPMSGSLVGGGPGPNGSPGGITDAPDGPYSMYHFRGVILVGNLFSTKSPVFPTDHVGHGSQYKNLTLVSMYTGPKVSGVDHLTVDPVPQYFPLPYFDTPKGITISGVPVYPTPA